VRFLLPLALMVALYIFLRGHNLPGGGFVAGLVVAIGLLLQYIASGFAWVEMRRRLSPHALIGAGILVATATGAVAWGFGRPFLTSAYGHVHPAGDRRYRTGQRRGLSTWACSCAFWARWCWPLPRWPGWRRHRWKRRRADGDPRGLAIGLMTAVGIYLILRRRSFPGVLGLTFLSHAVNLFIFSSGRLKMAAPPIVGTCGRAEPTRCPRRWC
jgi:hypothetical protein